MAMWDLVSGVRPPLTSCIFALPSATNCRTLLEPGHYPLLQETCQSCRQLAGSLPAAILPWPAFVQVPEWHPQGSSLWILVLFSSSSCQVGISFLNVFLSIHFHLIFPKIIFHCCNGLFLFLNKGQSCFTHVKNKSNRATSNHNDTASTIQSLFPVALLGLPSQAWELKSSNNNVSVGLGFVLFWLLPFLSDFL